MTKYGQASQYWQFPYPIRLIDKRVILPANHFHSGLRFAQEHLGRLKQQFGPIVIIISQARQ